MFGLQTSILAGGAAAVGLLLASTAIQSVRLDHAKHDLKDARDQIAQLKDAYQNAHDAFASSEANRAAEYGAAVKATENLNAQCEARISDAVAAMPKIRRIVERGVTAAPPGCPVPRLIGAGELRDVLGSAASPGSPGSARP